MVENYFWLLIHDKNFLPVLFKETMCVDDFRLYHFFSLILLYKKKKNHGEPSPSIFHSSIDTFCAFFLNSIKVQTISV